MVIQPEHSDRVFHSAGGYEEAKTLWAEIVSDLNRVFGELRLRCVLSELPAVCASASQVFPLCLGSTSPVE